MFLIRARFASRLDRSFQSSSWSRSDLDKQPLCKRWLLDYDILLIVTIYAVQLPASEEGFDASADSTI